MCLALAGCIADVDDDVNESYMDQAIESSNKLASNKLASNSLAANALGANKLALSSVGTGTAAASLINTADGREVLSYIISCALTSTQTVTLKDSSNNSYAFPGSLGLGSAWLTRALTLDEQKWVSACVFSRTNYFGVAVQLSMRGNNPLLATSSDEREDYIGLDGGFYGNLFDASGHPKEYACDGFYNDPQRVCANVATGGLTTCGFTYTGSCYTTSPNACIGAVSGAIVTSACRTTLTGVVNAATDWPDVIMVYLQE
jgi:hypothetical protein